MLLSRVLIGSAEHLLPIGIVVFCAFFLIKYSKQKSVKFQNKLIHYVALCVSASVVTYHLVQIINGNYNFKEDLPFYLCSFLGLIMPLFTCYRKYWMFEILVFWIIAGTLQGVLTPDIEEGFPSLDYFRYWIVHLGLLTIISYAIVVLKMKPKLKSVFKSFLVLQLYMVVLMVINYFLEANYSYLNKKPISGSVLDYLGDWPYYIIKVQLILVPAFMLIYFPFYIVSRKKN